jgi:hypothetical protein
MNLSARKWKGSPFETQDLQVNAKSSSNELCEVYNI